MWVLFAGHLQRSLDPAKPLAWHPEVSFFNWTKPSWTKGKKHLLLGIVWKSAGAWWRGLLLAECTGIRIRCTSLSERMPQTFCVFTTFSCVDVTTFEHPRNTRLDILATTLQCFVEYFPRLAEMLPFSSLWTWGEAYEDHQWSSWSH